MVTLIIVLLSVLVLSFIGVVLYLTICDVKDEMRDIKKSEDIEKIH